jgi:lysine-specific demethylase/histidyl-hydroxylase NO66
MPLDLLDSVPSWAHRRPMAPPLAPARTAMPRKKKKRSRITVEDSSDGGSSASAAAAEATPKQKTKKKKKKRAADATAAATGRFDGWRDVASSADTRALGHDTLGWMLHPMHPQTFFDEHWEQQPALIRRPESRGYYSECFQKRDLEELLAAGKLSFEHDLDITEYAGGKRSTYNGSGTVDAAQAWAKYKQGCSLRMLCPHAHSPKVWHLLSALEHSFGSFVGANVYLTPAGTQGFAPHYDDIEAFVLQLEGSKEWLIYPPLSEEETLPRSSSKDLTHTDIGQPVMSITLEAGDLLYFPRGWVHEAKSSPDMHSLHLTVSTALKHTFRDLLELVLPGALEAAAAEDIDFRQTLPPSMRDFMGAMHSDADHTHTEMSSGGAGEALQEMRENREGFHAKIMELAQKCLQPEFLNVDGAVDEMIRANLRSRLPPLFPENDRAQSTASVVGLLTPHTLVRLVRHDVAQLASGEDGKPPR